MKVACQRLTVGGKTVAVAPTLGWTTDAMHHVVIAETGVPQAEGRIRYPSEAPGHVEFPSSATVDESWQGWIDAINIGQATGTFKWRMSSTDTCSDQIIPDTPTFTLEPSAVNTQIFYGKGPADFYLCLMRYVP